MTIFNPFNFNPSGLIAIDDGVGPYSVPVNQYAMVSANVSNGSSFKVLFKTVLKSIAASTWTTGETRTTTAVDQILDHGETYTVPTNSHFTGFAHVPNQVAFPVVDEIRKIHCSIAGEHLFEARWGKALGATVPYKIFNANNQEMGSNPVPIQLGENDTIRNIEVTDFWNSASNEIHVVGHVETYGSESIGKSDGTSAGNIYWLPSGTSIECIGSNSIAVVTLYDKQ